MSDTSEPIDAEFCDETGQKQGETFFGHEAMEGADQICDGATEIAERVSSVSGVSVDKIRNLASQAKGIAHAADKVGVGVKKVATKLSEQLGGVLGIHGDLER